MKEDNSKSLGLGTDCYSQEEMSAPSKNKNQLLKKIPGEDSPLICKLIPDLKGPRQNGKIMQYWEVTEHQHCVGIDAKGKPILWSHPCQKTMGEKKCPECDKYYALLPVAKLAGEGTPEGKALKYQCELLTPKKKGWVYFVTPDADVIKAVKLPKDLLNKLWGKEKTKYRDAVPSLLEEMRKMAINPFDLKTAIGWLKIFRTGEGFGTNYFAEIAGQVKPKIVNGRPMGTETSFIEASVSEYVLKSYPLDELPDFRQLEFRNAFTPEESAAFAENPRVTPQRILDEKESSKESVEDADEAGAAQSTAPEVGMANLGMAVTQTQTAVTVPTTTMDEIDAAL